MTYKTKLVGFTCNIIKCPGIMEVELLYAAKGPNRSVISTPMTQVNQPEIVEHPNLTIRNYHQAGVDPE
jgi:hypothetical protein